jgi:hypothetical protein
MLEFEVDVATAEAVVLVEETLTAFLVGLILPWGFAFPVYDEDSMPLIATQPTVSQ